MGRGARGCCTRLMRSFQIKILNRRMILTVKVSAIIVLCRLYFETVQYSQCNLLFCACVCMLLFFRGEDKRSRTRSQPLPKILSCVYEREPLGWGGGHACRRCVWNVRTVQNYLLVAAIEDGERAGLEISRKG